MEPLKPVDNLPQANVTVSNLPQANITVSNPPQANVTVSNTQETKQELNAMPKRIRKSPGHFRNFLM